MKLQVPRPKPKWRSIRRQLIVLTIGVHLIVMSSFIADLTSRQQGFIQQRARARTLYEAGVLAASAIPQLATTDLAGLRDILSSLARDTSVRWACVTDETGKVLGDSDRKREGTYLSDAVSRKVVAGQPQARIFNEGPTTVSAAVPIVVDQRVLGWAWVTGDLAEDRTQLAGLRRTGLLYALIAVVFGGVLATLLANGITRQLRLLLAGTERLKHDNLDEPVPIVTENDVGAVARAFNSAMNALKRERAARMKARAELEAEVRERRRAENELKEANRAMMTANESLRQFAYAASHDLQEPLRGVAAYSQLLKKRYSGKLDSDADEFIGFIASGADRMKLLIKGLLDYSRAGGPGEEPPAEIDASSALASAIANLSLAIDNSGAEIIASDLPVIRAHHIALVQLFQNLIGNAIKYAGPERPVIRITGLTQNGYCEISVQDNGLGISQEQHKRIFGIFKRAHGSDYPGTGVGLAICSKIVERYGGRIWVESEPGHGATFRFTLPAIETGATSTRDSDAA
jgi:signal transduction histidine kinase